MLLEVFEVLHVQGRQRQAVSEAACCNPHVIGGAGSAALGRGGGKFAPDGGDAALRRDHGLVGKPFVEHGEVARSPVTQPGPLGQLAHGDVRDGGLGAGETGCELRRETVFDRSRRDVGVKNDDAHEGSGHARLAPLADGSDELVNLFIALEDPFGR
jgi:hypothetical protein